MSSEVSSTNFLDRILQTKRQEVERKKAATPLEVMEEKAAQCEFPIRPFRQTILDRYSQKKPAVIAELKKASPSKGIIRENFDIFALARSYERGHAACLSVLTDHDYFKGHDSFLKLVRETVDLPLLRKDFILDPYQVYESRVLGADAVILIAAALDIETLNSLYKTARKLKLDVLVEVHSVDEYKSVAHLGSDVIIGVNNRDLKTFKINTQTTFDIKEAMPADQWCITESGIHQRAQVESMYEKGIYGFLIGEALMRFESPGDGLKMLFPEMF